MDGKHDTHMHKKHAQDIHTQSRKTADIVLGLLYMDANIKTQDTRHTHKTHTQIHKKDDTVLGLYKCKHKNTKCKLKTNLTLNTVHQQY